MARRKRVARAANPISRGNLDQNEPRQTCPTMRRNFERGWWDRGCVKIEAKKKSILSSRKSENSLFRSISSFPSFFPALFLPTEFPPRCYYQNSKRIFLFFFWAYPEDGNSKESVDANLGRNLIFPFWPIENPRLLAIDSLGWKMGLEQLLISPFIKASRSSWHREWKKDGFSSNRRFVEMKLQNVWKTVWISETFPIDLLRTKSGASCRFFPFLFINHIYQWFFHDPFLFLFIIKNRDTSNHRIRKLGPQIRKIRAHLPRR